MIEPSVLFADILAIGMQEEENCGMFKEENQTLVSRSSLQYFNSRVLNQLLYDCDYVYQAVYIDCQCVF